MNGICELCNEFIHVGQPCIRLNKGIINIEDEFEHKEYLYYHEECLIEDD